MSIVAELTRREELRRRAERRCRWCCLDDAAEEPCALAEGPGDARVLMPTLTPATYVRDPVGVARWAASVLRSIELARELTFEEVAVRRYVHERGSVPDGATLHVSMDEPTPWVTVER